MKATPILIKTFTCDTAIANANRVVVASATNAGNVKLPAAANEMYIVGVITEPASDNGASQYSASVQVAGIAQIASDGSGTITAGNYVQIADSSGRIKQAAAPAFGGATSIGIVGLALSSAAATAGLLVDVLIMPFVIRP